MIFIISNQTGMKIAKKNYEMNIKMGPEIYI